MRDDLPTVHCSSRMCGEFLRQDLTVINPSLKIAKRRFNDNGRVEARLFHRVNAFYSEVVEQTQLVFALRTNVNIPPL